MMPRPPVKSTEASPAQRRTHQKLDEHECRERFRRYYGKKRDLSTLAS